MRLGVPNSNSVDSMWITLSHTTTAEDPRRILTLARFARTSEQDLRRGWFLAGKLRWRTKVRYRVRTARGRTIGQKFRPRSLRLHPRGDPGVPLGPGPGLLPCRKVLCAVWIRSSASAGLPRQSRVFAYAGDELSATSDSIRSTISRSA